MVEKSKAQITEELRAEYRAAIQRTADEEEQNRKGGLRSAAPKSIRLAYFFWFALGPLGVHRFYLGRPVSGAGMLAITVGEGVCLASPGLILLGWALGLTISIWWLADAFLIPRLVP